MPDIPGSLLTHGGLHSPHTHAWRWCLYMADLITGEHMASRSCRRPPHASVGGLNSSSGFSNLLLGSSINTGVGILRKGYVASHPRDGDFHFILLLSRCDSPNFSFTGVPKSGAQSLWQILGLPAQTRGRVVLGLQGEGMEIWGISVFIIPRSHSPYFCGFWSFQCLTFGSFQESTGSHVYPFPTLSS